jgi:DNA-directed RNA polymerase II subunit RPB1
MTVVNKNQPDTHEAAKKRGGCGAQQPNIILNDMKMVAEFKPTKKKNDDRDALHQHSSRISKLMI